MQFTFETMLKNKIKNRKNDIFDRKAELLQQKVFLLFLIIVLQLIDRRACKQMPIE
jgi:hypothetical protein